MAEADARRRIAYSAARALLAVAALTLGALAAAGERGPRGAAAHEPTRDAVRPPSVAAESFDPSAVNQVITQTASGGLRRVVANDSSDARQIGLLRAKLRASAESFGPLAFAAQSGGRERPTAAVTTLRAAASGQLHAEYLEIRGGGEIRYLADGPELLGALHAWLQEPWPQPAGARPATDANAFPRTAR